MIKWKSSLLTGQRIIDLLKKTKKPKTPHNLKQEQNTIPIFFKKSVFKILICLSFALQDKFMLFLYCTVLEHTHILVKPQNLFPGTSHRILLTTVMKERAPIECPPDERDIFTFSDFYCSLSSPPQSSTGKCCTKWQVFCCCLLTRRSQL